LGSAGCEVVLLRQSPWDRSVFKASLVVLFFMHVKYSPKLTKLVVVCGVFWLAIMLTMTETDLLTRTWMGIPGR
jgi:cytochrome c oxidase subunit 4